MKCEFPNNGIAVAEHVAANTGYTTAPVVRAFCWISKRKLTDENAWRKQFQNNVR
jgi:hypothetical protein